MRLKNIFLPIVLMMTHTLVDAAGFTAMAKTNVNGDPKIDSYLVKTLNKSGQANILVYLKSETQLQAATQISDRTKRIRYVYDRLRLDAKEKQKRVIAELKRRKLHHRSFYIENAIAVDGASKDLAQTLSAFPEVASVQLNAQAALRLPTVKSYPNQDSVTDIPSHLRLVGVDRVWNELGVKGSGIVVAGQDSGFYWEHNSIKKQYRGYNDGNISHNYNWHDAIHRSTVTEKNNTSCGYDSTAPCDDSGHGTHTMGTMVGADGGKNNIGVAPEAKWMGCRNMNKGVGTVSTYLECFEFFLAPYPQGGDPQKDGRPDLAPHVINNSWGCPESEGCKGPEFLQAVRAMHAAGIMVIAAAGNDGSGCSSVVDPPGNYSGELISVGAYNRYTSDIAFYSSRGPSNWNGGLAPVLVAPGTLIRSAINEGPNSYDEKAGTSMASPHVAGIVALLWSARPELIGQIQKTAEILTTTAKPMQSSQSCGSFPGHQIPNAVFGYGMVDAYKAITSQ